MVNETDEEKVVDLKNKKGGGGGDGNNTPTPEQLISQANNEIEKAAREAVKGKLRTLMQKKREVEKGLKLKEKEHIKKMEEATKEAKKAIEGIDAEVADLIQDLKDGLLP